MHNPECPPADFAQLAEQARAAYQQKRTRECLAITRTMALADPDNVEAEALQSAIRADLQSDLHEAWILLEHSVPPDQKQKYQKAAEIIALKTLYIDPENEEAKSLLESARALQGERPARQRPEELPFVAAPVLSERKESKSSRPGLSFVVAAIVVVGGGFALFAQLRRPHPGVPAPPVPQVAPRNADVRQPPPSAVHPAAPQAPALAKVAVKLPVPAAAESAPQIQPARAADAAAPAVPAATGKLAVSSPVVAEIYLGNRLLGTTPATLELPVGRQTLDYRHGSLRTVLTHDIKANETTAFAVTFPMIVQVNAKPWAQVFLDGATRRPLGQTPLSGVSVPIGGILVFENPGFGSKSYRITENDAAIQVDFP